MNNQFAAVQEWFDKHSQREKIYLFLSGFALLYLVYFIIFFHSVSAQKKDLLEKMTILQAQKLPLEQQINTIKETVKSPIYIQMIKEQKRLSLQLEKMQQHLENLKPVLFSGEDMAKLTKKILNQQAHATLISLEELPAEPWPPQAANDKTHVLNTVTGYQHKLQIEFQDDYFNTIEYLRYLEKISRHVYWDRMEYKVIQYPKADVVLKFHVLSLQKS